METKMFSLWSVRWLYHEYEASSRHRESREGEYNGTQQFQIRVNNSGRRIQEVRL
jgi:hypothetical protein